LSASSPLDEWRFLVGTWKGSVKGEFGEKGIVESMVTFSLEPCERFIMAKGESHCEGRLLNSSISLLFYDKAADKFRRKSFFSYGFVNNEIEHHRSSSEIRFDITMEPLPKQFEGTRWRSFIKKLAENKIALGLETAEEGEEFKSYGETVYTKTS
jgi:hypothetical protein